MKLSHFQVVKALRDCNVSIKTAEEVLSNLLTQEEMEAVSMAKIRAKQRKHNTLAEIDCIYRPIG